MSEPGIPIDIEKLEISSSLNSCLLLVFGMGMYTVTYFGTLYIYLKKSSSKSYIVPATITILFLCNTVQTGLQWYITKWQLVDNGDTRDSVFVSSFNTPIWAYTSGVISSYTGFMLADGLLIWRCYIAWKYSFRIISMSLFLFVIEIALFLTLIVFTAIYGQMPPTAALADRIDHLSTAAFFTTFGTSLVTTSLIAYRIYSASKQGVSVRRFQCIINIVVQSGAVYSLTLLLAAITPLLPGTNNQENTWSVPLDEYVTVLVNILAGMSTTILVAWVSMLPTDATFPSAVIHISGLQFQSCSARADTPGGMEAGHFIGVDRNSVIEGLRVEDKVQ